MKVFYYGKDGGQYSTVWGYWLVEIKTLFSLVLLRFENGTREAYHSHAFNCVSWILKGKLIEKHKDGNIDFHRAGLKPIITTRDTFHKVTSEGRTWVISFRGSWASTWKEYTPDDNKTLELTNGRKSVND